MILFIVTNKRTNRPAEMRPLDGAVVTVGGDDDPRVLFADWMVDPNNPYFAKAVANRYWAHFFGRGIVDPLDDMRATNPPSNPELLNELAKNLVQNKFSLKALIKTIVKSRTYQLSWKTNGSNLHDERNFSRAVPRRLPAEIAFDAVQMATASDAVASQMQTQMKGRAIAQAASNGNGKGKGSNTSFALQVFGKNIRESNCDCDRSMEASLLQTVYLQNDNQVLQACNGGADTWIDQLSQQLRGIGTRAKENELQGDELKKEIAQLKKRLERIQKEKNPETKPDQIARLKDRLAELSAKANIKPVDPLSVKLPENELTPIIQQAYLRTLSRPPTADEVSHCVKFVNEAPTTMEGLKGLLWTLLNTKEFIVNH